MSLTVKLAAGMIVGNDIAQDSMAWAIREAMNTLVPPPANEDPIGRMKLALAIAQGVVSYLKAKEQAFVVPVPTSAGPVDTPIRIDVQ